MQVDELFRGEFRRVGREDEIADARERFAFANAHVDLAGRGVHAHGFRFREKIRGNGSGLEQFLDGVADVRVGEHRAAGDFRRLAETRVAHAHAAHDGNAAGPGFRQDFFREAAAADFDAVFLQLVRHFSDEQIRAAAENVDAAAHEVGKDDAVGDCGLVERRAVGVGDGLEQKTVDVRAPREKFFEEFPRRPRVAVVVVHPREMFEKGADALGGNAELVGQNAREVCAVERRADVEFRVDEADVLELANRIRDVLRPVFAAGLDHPVRESVQRNVEDVPAGTLEERRQPAELIMVLQQQNGMSRLGEIVGAGHSGEPAADDDGVKASGKSVKRILRVHENV